MAIARSLVIDRLKAGERLIVTLPKGDCDADKPVYFLSGGGRVTAATYTKLKETLKPLSAGLFDDSEPQEWAWVN